MFKMINIVVIGDGTADKTSLIKCYINDEFPNEKVPTILDCYREEVIIDNHSLNLVIWDSGGEDHYSRLKPLGYENADVFLMCFSIDDRDSFNRIE